MRAHDMTRLPSFFFAPLLIVALALPAVAVSEEDGEAAPEQPSAEEPRDTAGTELAQAEDVEAEAESEADAETGTEADAQAETDAEAEVDAEAEAGAETEADGELAQAEADMEADAEADAEAEVETEAEVDAEVDVEVAEEVAPTEAEEAEPAYEDPLPPTDLTAFDTPNSAGDSITLQWTPAANEDAAMIVRYDVLRSQSPDGPWESVGEPTRGAAGTRDSMRVEIGETYYYKVASVTIDDRRAESEVVSAVAEAQWFHMGRWFILILALIVGGSILFNIYRARRGEDLYVRRIAGLESVDEAIGRSTEMGKPVLYVPGIRDMDDIQTIASMSILAHVAKLTAEYDTPILVPNTRAVVMSTAQEVVKQAYLDAGRPDAYQSENIRYLTDDQFGYVAGVDGIMIRDKPAANFFLGAFFAESLILAETGASTGAIQVAGTAMPSQLPFFVAACDYTLIGEELFAASAYLSREPQNLGSLKGQDWGKFVFMLAILLGVIGATVAAWQSPVDSPSALDEFVEARDVDPDDAGALDAALDEEVDSLREEVMDARRVDPEEEIYPEERAAIESETMERFEQRFGAAPNQIRAAPRVRAYLDAQPEELSTIRDIPRALREDWIRVRDELEEASDLEDLRQYERDERIEEAFAQYLREEFDTSQAELHSAVRTRRHAPDSWWNFASWWRSE